MKKELDLSHQDKLMIVTDWHRTILPIRATFEAAVAHGVKTIVHCGDLGYNFKNRNSVVFEQTLSRELEKHDLQMIWIDGNHENHPWLKSLKTLDNGFKKTGKSNRLFYAPRGHRWEMNGKKLGALGGAITIRKSRFVEGESVFSQHQDITDDDVAHLGKEKLHILFTHEAANGAQGKSPFVLTEEEENTTLATRLKVLKAIENTHPELVFAGHWHQFKKTLLKLSDDHETTVQLLTQEAKPNSTVILNLNDLSYEIAI